MAQNGVKEEPGGGVRRVRNCSEPQVSLAVPCGHSTAGCRATLRLRRVCAHSKAKHDCTSYKADSGRMERLNLEREAEWMV